MIELLLENGIRKKKAVPPLILNAKVAAINEANQRNA